jgi:hypothetical protein
MTIDQDLRRRDILQMIVSQRRHIKSPGDYPANKIERSTRISNHWGE